MKRGQFSWPKSFKQANERRRELIDMGIHSLDYRYEEDDDKRKLAQEFRMLQEMCGAFLNGCYPLNWLMLKDIRAELEG